MSNLGSPAGSIGVRVAASGIEASDIIQMAGGYGALAGGKKPVSEHDGTVQLGDLGCEGVGVVEKRRLRHNGAVCIPSQTLN